MADVATVNGGAGIPRAGKDGKPLTEDQRRRLYEKQLDRAYSQDADRRAAPFRALLFALYDEATAAVLWRQIEPLVKAGKEGVRREIGRNRKGQTVPASN